MHIFLLAGEVVELDHARVRVQGSSGSNVWHGFVGELELAPPPDDLGDGGGGASSSAKVMSACLAKAMKRLRCGAVSELTRFALGDVRDALNTHM